MIPRVASALMPPSLTQETVAPTTPFVWAEGGQRLSPETLARRQQQIDAERAASLDFSPVGHWTQGLARVANGLLAVRDQGRLNRDLAASNAATSRLVAALGSPDTPIATVTGALTDPDKAVRDAAELIWKQRNPTPAQPSEWERTLLDSGYVRGSPEWQRAQATKRDNILDPNITTNLPGGGIFSGSQSRFDALLGGGGDPASAGAAGAPSPPAEPFADAAQAGTLIQSMGAKGFLDWQGKHGVGIKVNSPEEMARLPAGTKVISPDGRVGIKR